MAFQRPLWAQSLACAILLPLVHAQSDPLATTVSASASSPTPPTTTVSGSDMPSSSDDAPPPSSSGSGSGSGSSNDSGTGTSLVNYYFVFLALILCVAVLAIILVWRKRRRAIAYTRYHRQNTHHRDGSGWQGSAAGSRGHGRYWQGMGMWGQSRDDVAAREEGLNELGEAPPAYMPPKTREEEEREAQQRQEELAMPMQTLSRESAGLKPPDYSESSVRALGSADRHSVVSEASGSRNTPEEHGTTSGGPSSS